MRKYFYFFLISFMVSVVQAQVPSIQPEIWQLSGIVINRESGDSIPYTQVVVNNDYRRRIIANRDGFYSIPVTAEDTVYYYALGYKPARFLVKKYLERYKGNKQSSYLYVVNYLNEDDIYFNEVTIFPYNNREELRTAITQTDIPRSIEEINASQNLAPEKLDYLIRHMKQDDEERFMVARNYYYQQYQNQYLVPTLNLLDPITIARMLKSVSDQSRKKKFEDLDYWIEN